MKSSSTCTRIKGDKSDCFNYQDITLRSIAWKILTRILLNKLVPTIAEENLPKRQCGLRANRSIIDKIFVLGQFQKTCQEQNKGLYVTCVNLTKAFDTGNSGGMQQMLSFKVLKHDHLAAPRPAWSSQTKHWPLRALPKNQRCEEGLRLGTNSLHYLLQDDAQRVHEISWWWERGLHQILSWFQPV